MAVGVEMSVERQARAREYARIRRRAHFARTAVGLAILALLTVTNLSKAVRTAIEERTTNQWLVVLIYVVLFGVVAEILCSHSASIAAGICHGNTVFRINHSAVGWQTSQRAR